MANMDCYRCNQPLSDFEMKDWQPFDFCSQCKLDIALSRDSVQSQCQAVRDYWQLSRNEQYRVRLATTTEEEGK